MSCGALCARRSCSIAFYGRDFLGAQGLHSPRQAMLYIHAEKKKMELLVKDFQYVSYFNTPVDRGLDLYKSSGALELRRL